MIIQQTKILSNGVKIPIVGHGTWKMSIEEAALSTAHALKAGYRHVDTAVGYGNHIGVAKGIEESDVHRKEIFITTKITADCKDPENAKQMIDEALNDLKTGYIDLLLIHAPRPWLEMADTEGNRYFEENAAIWQVMENAYRQGTVRAIGVSNFDIADLTSLFKNAEIKPMVHQMIYHIGNPTIDSDLETFSRQEGMLIEAYSPIGTGGLLGDNEIQEIANKYSVDIPQLAIRYCLQRDTVVLPKSKTPEFIEANRTLDFTIDDTDMNQLNNMHRKFNFMDVPKPTDE